MEWLCWCLCVVYFVKEFFIHYPTIRKRVLSWRKSFLFLLFRRNKTVRKRFLTEEKMKKAYKQCGIPRELGKIPIEINPHGKKVKITQAYLDEALKDVDDTLEECGLPRDLGKPIEMYPVPLYDYNLLKHIRLNIAKGGDTLILDPDTLARHTIDTDDERVIDDKANEFHCINAEALYKYYGLDKDTIFELTGYVVGSIEIKGI